MRRGCKNGLHFWLRILVKSELALGNDRWTEDDIVFLLSNGMTPDFEVIAGSMRAVQENMSKLEPTDQLAIARYLKSVSPIAPQPE
jgi:hypothetical protein